MTGANGEIDLGRIGGHIQLPKPAQAFLIGLQVWAELNVTVSGGTFSRRICLSILSASRHRPERCSTFRSELYVTVDRAMLRLRIRSTSASASFQRRGRAHAEISTL